MNQQLRVRPAVIDQATSSFDAALVAVACGDLASARRVLAAVDEAAVMEWYHRHIADGAGVGVAPRGPASWVRILRGVPGRGLRWWRDRRIDSAAVARRLDADHHRCRYCGTGLVTPDQLRRLHAIVGADGADSVDGAADAVGAGGPDDADPVHTIGRGGAVWLLTCATVDRVRLGIRGPNEPTNLISSCLPCQARRAGRPIDELGIDDPRDRPPAERPPWWPLLGVLDASPGAPVAVARHAVVLDGSTLNVGGVITGAVDRCGDLALRARSRHDVVDGPIEVLRRENDYLEFQAHVSLLDLLAAEPAPGWIGVGLVRQDSDDPSVGELALLPVPDHAATPNAAVMAPVPPVESLGRRVRLQARPELVVRVEALTPAAEVRQVDVVGDRLCIVLESSPPASVTITEVWLQRRGDAARPGHDRDRLRFDPGASAGDGQATWCLDAARAGSADHAATGAIWDVWAAWHAGDEWRTARVGRRRSDLLALRESVRLPRLVVACDDGARMRLTPYYAQSRHLAVKVTPVPAAAPQQREQV